MVLDAAAPDKPRKDKSNASFWRACRYLYPYRRIVGISVVCALFVGFISASGLATMLPILRVLINGDTIQGWVDRQIVEQRYGVTLLDNDSIARIKEEGLAAKSGLHVGDFLSPLQNFVNPHASIAEIHTTHGTVVANEPALPWYFAAGRDVAARLPTHPVKAIATVFGIIVCLAMLGNVFRFFQEYLSDKSAISAVNDIRRHLYDHVLHTKMSYFGVSGTSDVTSRLVQDAQGLQDGFKSVLGQSIQEPIKAAASLTLAMIISWKLTLVIVVFGPVMAVVIKKFGKKMRRANRAALQRSATMLGQIEGTLIGIRVVKSAGAERFERRRYATIMELLRREQLKMARYEAWATPAMETVAMCVVGVVLMFASYMVLVKKPPELSTGGFLLIMGCLVSIGESLRRVSKLNNVLQRSNAAAARIFEILDMPIERRRGVGSGFRVQGSGRQEKQLVNLPTLREEIRFESVSFAYANAKSDAVDEVSLVVPKGKSMAIVGRNGSGKTTLLALLPRFYDPKSGRISIDGVDIRDVTLRSLRRQISIVTQDPVIFPGSIAENIAYGDPRGSREQIIDAAKRAFAHDFIMEKSGGYDATLDGLGGQLSGGQKQRINIARAIYRQAPILVLDEATSQVDAESEHLIQTAIESLMHERTTFVIAHRFSTILSADTIVVMERGRVVGQGKHEELLGACETYQQLYERQLVGASG